MRPPSARPAPTCWPTPPSGSGGGRRCASGRLPSSAGRRWAAASSTSTAMWDARNFEAEAAGPVRPLSPHHRSEAVRSVRERGWREGGRSQAEPRFGVRAALGVAAIFLLLAILYTTPLVTHLVDGLPFAAVPPEGREMLWRVQGDYLQFYYYLWLVRDRLLHGASFLRDPYQFAVDGPRLNLPNTFVPFALPFVALSAAGPRFAYNALVLLSFPLAGLATALLAHRYGVGRTAAVVGGVVFACLPYRVGALLGGHPAGLAFGLVPLALWGLEAALAGSVAGGVWCGAALLSLAIVEPHFFYFAALGLPVYLVARLGLPGASRAAWRVGPGGPALVLAGAAAIGVGAVVVLARRGWTPPWPARLAVAAVVAAGV